MGLFEKITNYETDFTTYGLTFENYKWYKPLLIAILTTVFYLIFSGVIIGLFMATGLYPSNDMTILMILTVLSVIIFIPSLYISIKIVRDRALSTYLTQNAKWNWSIYIKTFAITLVIYLIVSVITALIEKKPINNTLTIITFLTVLILTPIQCFAEELLCRGFFMQAFGSWFKIPVVAIILQAIVFSILHVNFSLAFYYFLIIGFTLGVITWYSKGLETSSAIHAVNNLSSFVLAGLGLGSSSGAMGIYDLIYSIIVIFVTLIAIVAIEKKFKWFGFDF